MSTYQVAPGNLICFYEFENVETRFRAILNLVKKARLYNALSINTRIFTKRMEEFYFNGSPCDKVITAKVEGITLTYDVIEINNLFGFVNEGVSNFENVDAKQGLQLMGFNKKNPKLKGYKEKEFRKDFEFLAKIVRKCILC